MKINRTTTRQPKARLYRLVFDTTCLKYVIVTMMLFFLLHPVMPALASELDALADAPEVEESVPAADEPEVAVAVPDIEEIAADAVVVDVPPTVDGQTPVTDMSSPNALPVTPEEATTPAESDVVVVDDVGDAPDTSVPLDALEVLVKDVTSVSDNSAADVEVESVALEGSIETANEITLENEQGTTTVPDAEFYEITGTVSHSDSLYQFNTSQCVSMGSGAYHCFDAATSTLRDTHESLYVARDADGDKEIFITINGKENQITSNLLDDDAPYFDAMSDSVVWHRLVDGRYQILSYQDKKETLISADYQNSMEPHRAGTYTVWQTWVNEHWEVVLHDGKTTKLISTSPGQNIAPQVEGDYVIWNVTNGDVHNVAVYEIKTGLVSLIDDTEGARVYNPRFVLVYDTKFDNGDVITKGYDAKTGSVIPLAAQVPIAPKELPSSDQTGETRALLQNKSSSREDFNDEIELEPDTLNSASSTASSTTSTTVILVPEATTTVSATLPLTDFDIIVEPFSSSTATSTQ